MIGGRAAGMAAALLAGATGCGDLLPEPDLERMIEQPSLRPYERTDLFPDGRAMRLPPAHTVPRGQPLGQTALTTGAGPRPGEVARAIPVPVDRPLLERGRDRYQIFCAACHGLTGDADTVVARAMSLRRPRSLLEPAVAAYPPGHLFQVVSVGYGLMPAYGAQLSSGDRWAVVAYLRALQLSRRVPLDALPPELRREAEETLR